MNESGFEIRIDTPWLGAGWMIDQRRKKIYPESANEKQWLCVACVERQHCWLNNNLESKFFLGSLWIQTFQFAGCINLIPHFDTHTFGWCTQTLSNTKNTSIEACKCKKRAKFQFLNVLFFLYQIEFTISMFWFVLFY